MSILNKIFNKANTPETKGDRKDDPAKMQKDTAVGYSYANYLHGQFDRQINPDTLVKYKGANVYNKMLLDPQVSAVFNLKVNIIISRKMYFEPTTDGQEKIIDFFNRNVEDLISGTWLSALRGILMGKAYGYSLSEKIFRTEDVDGDLRWVIHKISPKPFNSFQFTTDKYGNLDKIKQESEDYSGIPKTLDPNKFIIYINKPEIDPIWGQSDLKSAYRAYWEKDITSKYWDIFIERMAGGFVSITPEEYAPGIGNTELQNLENMLKNLTGLSGMLLPKGYRLDMHSPDDNSAFSDRIAELNKEISRALLTPNLLGFSEQGNVGSYAQSQTQLDVFMMLMKEEGDYLADILNEQLFSQLAFWNFGVTEYPRAKFEDFTPEQKRLMAAAWVAAVKDSAVTNTPEDEIKTRQLLDYPEIEAEEIEKIKKENKPPTPLPIEPKDEEAKAGDDGKEDKQEASPPTEKESKQSENPNVSINIQTGNGVTATPYGDVSTVQLKNQVNNQEGESVISFVERIDFEVTEKGLDRIHDNFYSGIANSVDIAFNELSEAIKEFKKSGKEPTKDNIDKSLNKVISADTKRKLSSGIRNNLADTYNLAWNTSYKATERAAKQAGATDKFIKRIMDVALLSERKMCKEENWTFIHFVEGISLDVAIAWFKDKAFTITGDLTQDMIDAAANIMEKGIRENWSNNDMITELRDVLGPLTGGSKKSERARIETIIRTNMTTVFTQAQLAFYNDPDLNGFIDGLEYSAVLDNRTTPVCSRLNEARYPINDRIWSFITPPNHFNCRSILIPITILDNWTVDKRGFTEDQLPSKGFGQSGLAKMYDIELNK